MNVRNDVVINSPNNKNETCTEFVIDDITKPFMLNGTTDIGEDYTFSAWVKSSEESSINIYGESIPITTEWKRKRVTFAATGLGIRIYFDKVGTYYFYKSQLELGKVMSDASPSPEDIKASLEVKINRENLISEINASADIIRLKSNRLVVESDNLQISEDGTLKTQRGEIGGFILHDKILSAEADKHAEINIKYHTYADAEPREGFIKIGNDAENEGGSGEGGIYVQDYDLDGYEVYTRIGNVLGGGILIETEEPNDALHIDQNGIARVDGKAVRINGREHGVNTILWSGSWYMNSSHTITLSEAVSSQPNGIVLIFSPYINSESKNYDFIHHFVPKKHVQNFNDKGSSFGGSNGDGSIYMLKYIYIGDTTIKGYSKNNQKYTSASGINVDNSQYILRYVIGV